jgi:hypothetical protein
VDAGQELLEQVCFQTILVPIAVLDIAKYFDLCIEA